jgi:hypothetical protein
VLVFLLPFAVVIGALVLSGRKGSAAPQLAIAGAAQPPRAPGLSSSPPSFSGPGRPSPIAVLSDFVRANVQPPPIVVQCAIAEAEMLGRADLALELTRAYVIPALAAGGGPGPDPVPGPDPDQGGGENGANVQTPGAGPGTGPGTGSLPSVATRSPIAGVPDPAWQHFCGLLVRESPDFDGPRHVGRYHHRKDRLAEIGFDPSILAGAAEIQDDAFAADVADSFRHLVKSGTLEQVVGREVPVPEVGKVQITLSGMLGLASVAGLEGAIEWLQRPEDRTRYPYTTQAFLRSNGAF